MKQILKDYKLDICVGIGIILAPFIIIGFWKLLKLWVALLGL